jgi:predicted adenylyl cyclase CyaB
MEERLATLGFEFAGSIHQEDIIFDRDDGQMFRAGEKLRLRIEGDSVTLTWKASMSSRSDVSVREELSIGMDADPAAVVELFAQLGFPVLFRWPKQRREWTRSDVLVTIDEWPIVGYIIELEGDERVINELSSRFEPALDFANHRLAELLRAAEEDAGTPLSELQLAYEQRTGRALGRLAVIAASVDMP